VRQPILLDAFMSIISHECAALVQIEYAENVDVNSSALVTTIDSAKLPLNGSAGCTPTYPNQFVRVNNVFEVS
jgi:hypothetical protein